MGGRAEARERIQAYEEQLELAESTKSLKTQYNGMDKSESGAEQWFDENGKAVVALSSKLAAVRKGKSDHVLKEVCDRAELVLADLRKVAADLAKAKVEAGCRGLRGLAETARAWYDGLDRKTPWPIVRQKITPLLSAGGGGAAETLLKAHKKADDQLKCVLKLKERFGIEAEMTEFKKLLGTAFVPLAEFQLASIITDCELTQVAKQAKLTRHFTKISQSSRDYGYDVKGEIVPCLVSLSVGKLLE
eukprot:694592-Amphidinium_carterae.1